MDKPRSEKDVIKAFQKTIENMPQEEFDKMVAEIDAMGMEGPTVDEYFDAISGHPKLIAELNAKIKELEAENERLLKDNVEMKTKLDSVDKYLDVVEAYMKIHLGL